MAHQQSKSEIINKQLLPEELEGTHQLTMDENLHSRFKKKISLQFRAVHPFSVGGVGDEIDKILSRIKSI